MKTVLKWAGNKTSIIYRIKELLPEGDRLFEPFVGSAAVTANTDYSRYVLSDANEALILLYTDLKFDKDFAEKCKKLFDAVGNTPEVYYERRREFNDLLRQPYHAKRVSELLVYLNRHGYNGLYRVSQTGNYNVPFGKYKHPYFPAAEMNAFAEKLKYCILLRGDFKQVMHMAKAGDVIYADPPFVPLSETANFTGYAADGFTATDQTDLRDLAAHLRTKGVSTVISNHDCGLTRLLYEQGDAKADEIVSFSVASQVSCVGERRKARPELLVLYKGR